MCGLRQWTTLFSPSPRMMKGSTLFTSSGTKYYHMFNLSLCGDVTVSCTNNVSFSLEGESNTVLQKLHDYLILLCIINCNK